MPTVSDLSEQPAQPDQPSHASTVDRGPALRAMRAGQHVIALVLVVVGVIRAATEGTNAVLAVLAGIALLGWYGAGMWRTTRPSAQPNRKGWVLGLALVWLAAVALSAEFVWVAFLLWLLVGYLLTGWQAAITSLLIFAVVTLAPLFHLGTTSYANFIGPLIGGLFALGISRGYLELLRDARERQRLVSSLQQAQRELVGLQDELASAQRHSGAVAERQRLARDIHDTIAQGLSSIRLLAHAASDLTPDAAAERTLAQIETLASESLRDVRRILDALTPAELEDSALASALRTMLERLSEETGLSTDLRVDDSLPALPTHVEVALLRTAQSALANVRLHSGAGRVVVSLMDGRDAVRLDIIDDGMGFEATEWDAAASGEVSSYGLRFMRSRLRELGGGLEIETAPGEGTALSAHVPLFVTGVALPPDEERP